MRRWAAVTSAGTAGAAMLAGLLLVAPPAGATGTRAPSPPAPPTTHPAKTTRVGFSVAPNGTTLRRVGIAYPLIVTFPQTVRRKGAVERGLRVTVDGKPAVGAWSWRTGATVMYRPRHGFWPANARITLHADLAGTVLARSGAHGRKLLVANKASTRQVTFRTARAFVARIDDRTHRMVVRKNGKKIKTIGVSLGMAGFRTRSGIKVATDKYAMKRMVSTTPGASYDVMSPWAVRITPTGEFIHGAPWAMYRIGRYDGSHGCTNVSVSDAEWYYDRVMVGDPVITTGTGRPMEWDNGLGGPWNVPWSAWLAKSRLKGAAG